MIKINDLEFKYKQGDFNLKIPDLTIEKGRKVAIVGASGCGKTTLLHLIAGIKLPIKGSITINSVNIEQLKEQDRRQFRISNIGFIFQDFELINYLNVFDNIIHCYRLNPTLKLNKEIKNKAYNLAEKVGIKSKINSSINQLLHLL